MPHQSLYITIEKSQTVDQIIRSYNPTVQEQTAIWNCIQRLLRANKGMFEYDNLSKSWFCQPKGHPDLVICLKEIQKSPLKLCILYGGSLNKIYSHLSHPFLYVSCT